MYWRLFLVLAFSSIAVSQTIIKTLPGFQGDLPFKLETGYVGVGNSNDIQMFYYFVKSERNPRLDPLMLWLTGGPGCSAFSGLAYEIGPFMFDFQNRSADLPTLVLNPFSWTKVANIIFLDSPVGTGFSYAQHFEGYHTGDTLAAAHVHSFLKKWLVNHSEFLRNPLYISGDSYSGLIVPIVALEISDGNEGGQEPQMNLQGYLLGNALVDEDTDYNTRVPFAHRMTFLSDELYQQTKTSCGDKYWNVDPSNAQCTKNLQAVNQCVDKVNFPHVMEDKCSKTFEPKPNCLKWDPRPPKQNFSEILLSPFQLPEPRCRSYNYLLSYYWANDRSVQKALGVRKGTIEEWMRCNYSIDYTHDVFSTVSYIRNLNTKGYRGLVYSGDHDMVIPHLGTQKWIASLNLSIADDWRPWFVNGQVAGFTIKYSNSKHSMVFATVKGGGHTAPEYKPRECLAMLFRWFAYYAL